VSPLPIKGGVSRRKGDIYDKASFFIDVPFVNAAEVGSGLTALDSSF
jgi:hypothetical protein